MWESRSSPLFTKARQLCCRAFFVKSGDDPDAKPAASHPHPCLGALPLLYPAAPPSVFAYEIGKYTAPAVALGREYVVDLQGVLSGFLRSTRLYNLLLMLVSHQLQCLGALPLLYPAAPPSVFAYFIGKYTAPAVALVREVPAC